MAKDLNQVVLTGRFGKKPEIKLTSNGKSYVDFTLANGQGFGEHEETEWISCKAWTAIADLIGKYCDKGTKVTIVGSLRVYNYTDKNGNQASRTYVNVSEFYFAESKSSGNKPVDNGNHATQNAAPNSSYGGNAQTYGTNVGYGNEDGYGSYGGYPPYDEYSESDF